MSATAQQVKPSRFIEEWGSEVLAASTDDGGIPVLPDPEGLEEVIRTLHAVQEFLIEPIGDRVKAMVAASSDAYEARTGLIPEDERPFDYADVGRLIVFADTLRAELGCTLTAVQQIALLAHDDIPLLAQGHISELQSVEPGKWNKHLRRIHGLDEVL